MQQLLSTLVYRVTHYNYKVFCLFACISLKHLSVSFHVKGASLTQVAAESLASALCPSWCLQQLPHYGPRIWWKSAKFFGILSPRCVQIRKAMLVPLEEKQCGFQHSLVWSHPAMSRIIEEREFSSFSQVPCNPEIFLVLWASHFCTYIHFSWRLKPGSIK